MATSWAGLDGNLWLFGGDGNDSSNYNVELNDLWEFNPTSGKWTWICGANVGNQRGTYGIQGIPATSNIPGGRQWASGWIDGSGNLWIFGGIGFDSNGSLGALSDLWEFNITSQMWMWVSGSNTVNQSGTYGAQGVSAVTNQPGGRTPAAAWTDKSGNFWLFGGNASSTFSGYGVYLNDLWRYEP